MSNKIYRITRSAENLSMNVDDPSSHYYKEYLSVEDADKENPFYQDDFVSKEEAQSVLDSKKAQYAKSLEDYLEAYYARIQHPEALASAKKHEAGTVEEYERIKQILPALKVIECKLVIEAKEVG